MRSVRRAVRQLRLVSSSVPPSTTATTPMMAMTADSEPVLAGVGVLLVELRVVVVEVRVAVADVALLVAVLVKPVEPPVGSKGSVWARSLWRMQ